MTKGTGSTFKIYACPIWALHAYPSALIFLSFNVFRISLTTAQRENATFMIPPAALAQGHWSCPHTATGRALRAPQTTAAPSSRSA